MLLVGVAGSSFAGSSWMWVIPVLTVLMMAMTMFCSAAQIVGQLMYGGLAVAQRIGSRIRIGSDRSRNRRAISSTTPSGNEPSPTADGILGVQPPPTGKGPPIGMAATTGCRMTASRFRPFIGGGPDGLADDQHGTVRPERRILADACERHHPVQVAASQDQQPRGARAVD